jgi:hypothetical protein
MKDNMSIDTEKMVKAINTLNLRHRKNWYPSEGIGKIPTGEHFMNEAEELVEALIDMKNSYEKGLQIAIVEEDNGDIYGVLSEWPEANKKKLDSREHVLEEIGDVFGTLMQLCYNLGFTFEQIDEKAVEKMRMRFDNGDKVDLSEYGD